MGGKSKKLGKKSSKQPQTYSQAAESESSADAIEKLFSRMTKFASKGKSIEKVHVRELKTFGHPAMEMVLTLFDGAVFTGSIPAIIESGDESFITSYSKRAIAPALIGHAPTNQESIDGILSEILNEVSKEHLSDKMKKIARNVNWATSVAVCKAGAYANNMASHKYVRKLLVCYEPQYKGKLYDIPECVFTITNGEMNPAITSAQQHLLIVHKKDVDFCVAIERTKNIYHSYFQDKIIEEELSYTPNIQDIKKGLEELTKIIDHLGYKKFVSVGLDVRASQFYESSDSYRFRCKEEDNAHLISSKALNDIYISLLKDYDLQYVEDAFHPSNWDYFSKLDSVVRRIATVTSESWKLICKHRVETRDRICNSILVKVSRAGSVTELIEFVTSTDGCYFSNVMDTHSESSDPFIADLCVGLMMRQMKIGVSCVTSNCKVCDQLKQIVSKMDTVRFLGFDDDGRPKFEIISNDTDDEYNDWNKFDDTDERY